MIKQFNFYDIYGYLVPGIGLLGLLCLPIGLIAKSWPEQDLSKALFLAALAYIAGHILQTIATNAVPSKVMLDSKNRARFPSDRLLDATGAELSRDFKVKLARQVYQKFGLDLHVGVDGDGTGAIFSDRNTAFFQARSHLIARKTAHYVEQFEGLYAMMRGLACALLAGACYLVGWALAFHREFNVLNVVLTVLGILALIAALFYSLRALSRDPAIMRRSTVNLAISLLVLFGSAGFVIGTLQPSAFWTGASSGTELLLWSAACLCFICAARCFSAYRAFAVNFAQSVWRDFSVYLAIGESAANGSSGDEADDEESD